MVPSLNCHVYDYPVLFLISMAIIKMDGIMVNMNDKSSKHFDSIHDAYDFFQNHSTEAKADIDAYTPHMIEVSKDFDGPVRLLDFGCGDGAVTARLLSKVNISPSQLRLSLVEPDATYLNGARKILSQFTEYPIKAWRELPDDLDDHFEIIVSNNVLYYVIDLKKTLSSLISVLSSPGVFISSEAGKDNILVQYTFPLFEMIGKPYPFYLAEDCICVLRELGESFDMEDVFFELKFKDSDENRLCMARFLMGQDYQNIPREEMLRGFNRYSNEGNIAIRTNNKHIILKR